MMEKFKALAWHFQLLALVGIAALVYGGVWYFLTSVTRADTQITTDQVTQLQQQNQTARIATERIDEFRTLYTTKAAEYDELKVLLPEQREITNVLQGLQDTAGESRLIVMRFRQNLARPVSRQVFTTRPLCLLWKHTNISAISLRIFPSHMRKWAAF